MSTKLRFIDFLFLMLTFVIVSSCGVKTDIDKISSGNRMKYNFNNAWLFSKSNPKYANKLDFNDSQWRSISCPHTFNDEDTYDEFPQTHLEENQKMWCGTVWYRKHFKLPKEADGKQIYIEFESVHQEAVVYLNGFFLGKNKTAFIPFGYDLTPYIKYDADNVIAIKVSNERGEYFKDSTSAISKQINWQSIQGGISSNVFLYTMDPLHITLPLYDNMRTVGTYFYSHNKGEKKVAVNAEVQVSNNYSSAKRFVLETLIFDSKGALVANNTLNKTIGAHESIIVKNELILENPHRWSTRDPYLYRAYNVVKEGNQVLDAYKTSFGVRQFKMNLDSGLWINDEYVKLCGWTQRMSSSWAGLGVAFPDWLHEYSFKLMDDAGANYIRWRHSSATPKEVEMADKYGFVSRLPSFAYQNEDIGKSREMRLDVFRKMLICYRNHPSIFAWDVGELQVLDVQSTSLLDLIAQYDPNGNRLMGNRRSLILEDVNQKTHYERTSVKQEAGNDDLDVSKQKASRAESPRRIWDHYTSDYSLHSHSNYNGNVCALASEDFALKTVQHWWNSRKNKHSYSAGLNSSFTDAYSIGNCPTEVACATGQVDAVRLPKESYYALKSIWRSDPQVYILGHWNYKEEVRKPMYVISNCTKVKLYINERVVAVDSVPQDGFIFEFPDIVWEAGVIRAEAYDGDECCVSHEKHTVGAPVALKISPVFSPHDWLADGADVALLDIEVIDNDGLRCPLDHGRVDFTISGPGIWRGGYNSGKENSVNNLYLDTECGVNRVAIRSLPEPGRVIVTAHRKGLKSARLVLESKQVVLNDGLSPL